MGPLQFDQQFVTFAEPSGELIAHRRFVWKTEAV
ncbi:MAG: hypothetical protein JWM11_2987 [Planctomycetaceae bacterium]|nr:hypothetical protein [Planctomycetaceae bacterium]